MYCVFLVKQAQSNQKKKTKKKGKTLFKKNKSARNKTQKQNYPLQGNQLQPDYICWFILNAQCVVFYQATDKNRHVQNTKKPNAEIK